MAEFWQVRGEALRIEVHVVPRASKSGVLGLHGERLKVALAAPPSDGKANHELIRMFAELARVPRSAVTLTRGAKSRQKTLAIDGLTREATQAFVRVLREAAAAD